MKEEIKKIFCGESKCYSLILIFIFIVLILVLVYVFWISNIIEIDWENIHIINWDAISAIALIFTAFYIAKQASATKIQSLATKKLVNKTILPSVNVGLKLRGLESKISIHNLSGFPIWIWLNIKLFPNKDFKKEEELLEVVRYKKFPIPPIFSYEFPLEKIDSNIEEYDEEYDNVYARIRFRCNANSYLPESDVKQTELIFRYDVGEKVGEKVWIIDDVGMEFMPLYEQLRKT